jgi:hypothetical protein
MYDFFIASILFLGCFSVASFLSIICLKLCLDITNSNTYNLFHGPTLDNEYAASDYDPENYSDSECDNECDNGCDNGCDGDCCKDVSVNETTIESPIFTETTNVSEHYKTD